MHQNAVARTHSRVETAWSLKLGAEDPRENSVNVLSPWALPAFNARRFLVKGRAVCITLVNGAENNRRKRCGRYMALIYRVPTDGNVLYQGLLAHGFSELLAMAGGEGTTEPWPRIHAFNALRVAFGDSCLTNVASAYFSRGA